MNIATLSSDSAVPGVNRNAVHARKWVLPDSNIFKKYWELLEFNVEKLQGLKQQSRTLSKLRDTVLPKLMSGEIRIPEAEKLVEKAEQMTRNEL